jgi:enolase-phosphatase E1
LSAPHLLLDIEGTTTPVSFVTDTLFPFARKRLAAYLLAHPNEPAVLEVLKQLAEEHAKESRDDPPPPWNADIAGAPAYLHWLMDRDRKATPLKTLQGLIWENGFQTRALLAPVYDDVPQAFERWRRAGRDIAIFSSGSTLAQRLLFAHTNHGDLSALLSGHFDTTTGPKREAGSYRKIAAAWGHAPGEILFVSDVAAELDAARQGGMRTALCVRPGVPEPRADHWVVTSFLELE